MDYYDILKLWKDAGSPHEWPVPKHLFDAYKNVLFGYRGTSKDKLSIGGGGGWMIRQTECEYLEVSEGL